MVGLEKQCCPDGTPKPLWHRLCAGLNESAIFPKQKCWVDASIDVDKVMPDSGCAYAEGKDGSPTQCFYHCEKQTAVVFKSVLQTS